MRFSEKSCEEFTALLAGKDPVPGGGGAAALEGALAAALGNMVGSLTVGKKKFAAVEEEMQENMDACERLRQEFLELIDADAEGFGAWTKAYSLSKNTEEEIRIREEAIQEALKICVSAPLKTMRCCGETIFRLALFAEKGSRLAVSDAGVAALFAKAAMQAAALNVFINTKSMKDREYAESINEECRRLLEECLPEADRIYTLVRDGLI